MVLKDKIPHLSDKKYLATANDMKTILCESELSLFFIVL